MCTHLTAVPKNTVPQTKVCVNPTLPDPATSAEYSIPSATRQRIEVSSAEYASPPPFTSLMSWPRSVFHQIPFVNPLSHMSESRSRYLFAVYHTEILGCFRHLLCLPPAGFLRTEYLLPHVSVRHPDRASLPNLPSYGSRSRVMKADCGESRAAHHTR